MKQTNGPLQSEYGKVPPQSRNLEEAILGAIMLEKDSVMLAAQLLQPEMFYVDAHQEIFKAILQLFRESQPIDLLTVMDQLTKNDKLDAVGGAYYITKLTNDVVSSAHVEGHCKIVAEKHMKREMIRIGHEMINSGFDEAEDAFELLDSVSGRLAALSLDDRAKTYTTIAQSVETVLNRLVDIMNKPVGSISGITTGIEKLDKCTDGWQPQDLIVLAARPSIGKSALAGNLARLAADQIGVGIFSLEMSHQQWTERIISATVKIELSLLKKGDLTMEQFAYIEDIATKEVSGLKIFIDDQPNLNLFGLKAKARRMVQKDGVKLIIIDYLQLMSGDRTKGQNREQEISSISRGLKNLAKELHIPIIALSQLNRESEKMGPSLASLRESGAIEQDADMVVFLVKPSEELVAAGDAEANELLIKIAKHRNGSLESIRVKFFKDIQKFDNVVDEQQEKYF